MLVLSLAPPRVALTVHASIGAGRVCRLARAASGGAIAVPLLPVALTACAHVIVQDEFVDNARLLVFEAYCRIHQCIDLRMLAAKLNMDESAAEKWVVNLIRNADLNAKINSQVRAREVHTKAGFNRSPRSINVVNADIGFLGRLLMSHAFW